MKNNDVQNGNNKKGFLSSFKKTDDTLKFYDAGTMFIGQFILQYMLQLVLLLLLNSIFAYKLGVSQGTQEGADAIAQAYTQFSSSTVGIIIVVLINEITMILSPLAFWKIKSFNPFKGVGFKRKLNGSQIAMTLPISIGLLAGIMPLATLFISLVEMTGYTYTGANIVVDSFGKLVLYLIFVAALPAVCEEILHRGMIARGASNMSVFVAIILSSTIFSLMHGSPVQLVHQFFVGVVCCLVYFMTGSIWASILTHFLNNAITLISGYVIFLISGSTELAIPWWGMLILCIGGLAILIASFIGMYKICLAKRKKEDAAMDIEAQPEIIYSGKKRRLNSFNSRMAYLFKSPEQVLKEKEAQRQIDEQLAEYGPEKIEVYNSLRDEEKVETRKKNSRAIIFTLVVVTVLWIIGTIGGY